MGQSSSSERQAQAAQIVSTSEQTPNYEPLSDGRRSEAQEQESLLGSQNDRRSGLRNAIGGFTSGQSVRQQQQNGSSSTYRRETRARSTLITPNAGPEDGDTHARDDVVLEQEERPLIMRDMSIRLNDAPITDIRASPMPRRTSVLSRIGSRVVPRYSRSTTAGGNGAGSEERSAALTDLTETSPASQAPQSRRRRRLHANTQSMIEPLSLTTPHESIQPRRNSLSTATFPLAHQSTNVPHIDDPDDAHAEAVLPPIRPSRGARLRRSLFGPVGDLFHRRQARPQRSRNTSYNNSAAVTDETRNLISPQGTGNTLIDPQGSNAQFHHAEEGTEANPVELESPDRPRSWLSRSRDIAHDSSGSRDDSSGIQHVLGGRSSRLIRREDDTPLSRVLQLAAAAIARQLSGTNDPDPALQSVGDDHFDGNLNNFIRTLNTAAEQSANDDADPSTSNLPPLNFWRVFRFVSHNNASSGLNSHPPTTGEGDNSRLVTLVVVGVRSVPSSSVLGETAGTLNTNLDDLMALPTSPPDGMNLGPGLQTQPSSTRYRLQRRRTSLTGSNPFPSQYDSQRHQGTSSSRLNRTAGLNPLRRASTSQVRPPSPFPTAEPSSSAADRSSSHSTSRTPSGDPTAASTLRQRRRNESHGNLGSGAARRNGVVEPDNVTRPPPASNNGRHWLIYVVGTNLSEDHPAFQAPSLFTDNPSYEDMVMLSTLLGPVKPPVATADEIAAARGVFRLEIRRRDGSWSARPLDRQPSTGHGVPSLPEALSADVVKCLVCQDDFNTGDEVRQLTRCRHVFHKECVDQWLTTGRNSCPTCRTTGVETVAVEPVAE